MVANTGRFGFVNYVFEPWHWGTGERMLPGVLINSLPLAGSGRPGDPLLAPPPAPVANAPPPKPAAKVEPRRRSGHETS